MDESAPYGRVIRVTNRCNALDTKELLKQEIYKQSFDEAVSNKLSPAALGGGGVSGGGGGGGGSGSGGTSSSVGFEDWELYFDSTAREGSSNIANGELLWSIPMLNNNLDVENIIEMQIQPFFFPRLTGAATAPDYFFFRRIYMRVLTAPATQSIHAQNSNYYHFEFDVDNLNSVAVRLTPVKPIFFFLRPQTSFTEFQIRFLLPLTFASIPLPNDTVTIQSIFPGTVAPAQFIMTSLGDTTAVLSSTTGAQPAPGVAVYISGFNSNSVATNNNVNAAIGHYVADIIDSVNFTVADIDTSATSGSFSATMIIAKNRIAFSVRFTSVKNQITNYIIISRE